MKIRVSLCIVFIFILVFGNGIASYGMTITDGDGKDAALDLVESTPENGGKAVALDTHIKLIFNKNVVNMTVKDNNAQCFLLVDSSNQGVPIDLIFADDKIEPDKKREIILKPKEALQENMTYKVEISPKLQAKNGTSLDKTVSFSFTTLALVPVTTESQAPAQSPAESQKSQPQEEKTISAVETPIPTDTAKATEETQPIAEAKSEVPENIEVDSNKQNISASTPKLRVWLILPAVIVAFIIVVGIKAKKRKS